MKDQSQENKRLKDELRKSREKIRELEDLLNRPGSSGENLQRSVENLSSVINNISEAVFIHDREGSIFDLNKKALELFGINREKVLKLNFRDHFFLPRNPLEKLSELWPRLEAGESFFFEIKAIRPLDKVSFPAEIFMRKILWDGRVLILTTVRDITRLKEDKKALRARRQQLSAILDGTPVATFVIDREHRVISWNRACENLTGVPREKVLGERVDSGIFYQGSARPVLADVVLDMDEKKMVELYSEKNLATCLTIPEAYEACDQVVLKGVPREIYFLAARYRDSSREVVGAIETISDITERTRTENALRASEKRLREVTANIPGVVYQYHVTPDKEGRFTFVSDGIRRFFNLDPGKVMEDQNLFFSRMDLEVQKKFKKSCIPCSESHCMEEFVFVLEKNGGEKRWIKNRALSRVMKNKETFWNGVLTDITQEKKIEKLRQDVERIVRHDMKSPLMGIGGLARLMLREDLTSRQRKFAATIHQSALKLLRMINNSMSLLKMEEGVYELSPEDFNILEMFSQLEEEFMASMESKSLETVYYLDGRPVSGQEVCVMSGEKILLESLFANLIQNALEASPEGERITISIRCESDEVVVDIHNMTAIPESVRDSFFNRYVTFGKRFGTGLGTYSAMLIAKAHQGDIRFTTSDEKGTTLTVTLPRGQQEKKDCA